MNHITPAATAAARTPAPTLAGPVAPRVVALHCSASSPRQWAAYSQRLAPGVELIAPALGARPSGHAAAGVTAAGGLDAEAERLWREVGDGPVHLVGHSFGAAVALTMARQRPGRVVSATLYEPILFTLLRSDGPAPAWDEITAVGRHISARVAEGQAEQGARLFCDYWGGIHAWARMSTARRAAVVSRMDDVAWNFEVLFEHAVGAEALARLDLPIQVLCGQRSPQPARRCSERVARSCPDASLILLDGAGHMEPVERPNRVLPLLPFAAARADAAASRTPGVAIAGAAS